MRIAPATQHANCAFILFALLHLKALLVGRGSAGRQQFGALA